MHDAFVGFEPSKGICVRVLLVEDDVAFSAAVCACLRAKAFLVDPMSTVAEAGAILPLVKYTAVLLNLQLGDGLPLLAKVRTLKERPIVIVLTARDQVTRRIRALNAGADDYLNKPCDPDEVLVRLRAAERKRSAGNTPLLHCGDLEIDLVHDKVHKSGVPVPLTSKEWALLRVMATRPDRTQTRERLQDALYGFHDEADSNTLEVFISRLRRKLGRNHIQTLRGLGYRLVQSAPPSM